MKILLARYKVTFKIKDHKYNLKKTGLVLNAPKNEKKTLKIENP